MPWPDPHADTVMRRCLAIGAIAVLVQAAVLAMPGLPEVRFEHTSFVNLHLLIELFAVTISLLIAAVSWHAHGAGSLRPSTVVIGGFTAVALCDIAHSLTYAGMPPFLGESSTERAIFYWLMGRSIEVVTVLVLLSPAWAAALTRTQSLAAGLALTAALVAWDLNGLAGLPRTFVPGEGVTPFKSGFEVAIMVANFVAAALWWRRARRDNEPRGYLIATACWVIGVGALSFMSYVAPSDFQNIFGHVFKIVGYALLYNVSFISNVRMPFDMARAARERAEDSERRLRALSDNLPNAVVMQMTRDEDGRFRFLHLSDAVERVLGVPAAEVMANPDRLQRDMHPDDQRVYVLAAARALKELSTLDVTVRQRHRDGSWRWLRLVSAPRHAADGRLVWDGLAIDITQARVAELQHREQEAMLAAVIHSASDAVISTDADGRITLFNPAARRIFGHSAAHMIGQPLERLLPPGDGARHAAAMASFARSGVSSRRMGPGRVKGRRADGSELELEASISQVTVHDRLVLTAILRDVTERVRTERALVKSQVELTALTHQLMEQEKQTTRRLAQVLHDQLGQTLTAMRIDFVGEARLDDPRQAERHARVDRLIDQAVAEVRQVLVELRPTLLDERGLVEALHNELQTRQRSAPDVPLQLDLAPELESQRWNPDVEYAAFMIAREAVGNALRHARATQVEVRLEGDPRRLRLEVRDDGDGMPPGAPTVRPGHLGMVGMRERAMAIGARFEVADVPQGGTAVILTWEDPRP